MYISLTPCMKTRISHINSQNPPHFFFLSSFHPHQNHLFLHLLLYTFYKSIKKLSLFFLSFFFIYILTNKIKEMVKLASAREIRMYGPRLTRNRSEYMNAGLYLFATVVLLMGFLAQFSWEPKSGLVLLLIGFFLIIIVNVHDLVAHLAGIDYRMSLMEFDIQLALVEFAVPFLQTLGSILSFFAIFLLFILVIFFFCAIKLYMVN